jgi:hypothetical protein
MRSAVGWFGSSGNSVGGSNGLGEDDIIYSLQYNKFDFEHGIVSLSIIMLLRTRQKSIQAN